MWFACGVLIGAKKLMSKKSEKVCLTDRSIYELEALIDAGSEEAAKMVLELLIDHLYSGTPVPYEYRFRLSLGLKRFVVEVLVKVTQTPLESVYEYLFHTLDQYPFYP